MPCASAVWPASSPKAALKPWSRSVIGSSAKVRRRRSRTMPRVRSIASRITREVSGAPRPQVGERRLEHQPDTGDRLLRPIVQRQGEPPALLLLRGQQPVGEARALALALLRLRTQRAREREEARVLARARAEVGEHA